MKDWLKLVAIDFGLLCFMTAEVEARITLIEIVKTEPAFGGQFFGHVGAYERLVSRVEEVW